MTRPTSPSPGHAEAQQLIALSVGKDTSAQRELFQSLTHDQVTALLLAGFQFFRQPTPSSRNIHGSFHASPQMLASSSLVDQLLASFQCATQPIICIAYSNLTMHSWWAAVDQYIDVLFRAADVAPGQRIIVLHVILALATATLAGRKSLCNALTAHPEWLNDMPMSSEVVAAAVTSMFVEQASGWRTEVPSSLAAPSGLSTTPAASKHATSHVKAKQSTARTKPKQSRKLNLATVRTGKVSKVPRTSGTDETYPSTTWLPDRETPPSKAHARTHPEKTLLRKLAQVSAFQSPFDAFVAVSLHGAPDSNKNGNPSASTNTHTLLQRMYHGAWHAKLRTLHVAMLVESLTHVERNPARLFEDSAMLTSWVAWTCGERKADHTPRVRLVFSRAYQHLSQRQLSFMFTLCIKHLVTQNNDALLKPHVLFWMLRRSPNHQALGNLVQALIDGCTIDGILPTTRTCVWDFSCIQLAKQQLEHLIPDIVLGIWLDADRPPLKKDVLWVVEALYHKFPSRVIKLVEERIVDTKPLRPLNVRTDVIFSGEVAIDKLRDLCSFALQRCESRREPHPKDRFVGFCTSCWENPDRWHDASTNAQSLPANQGASKRVAFAAHTATRLPNASHTATHPPHTATLSRIEQHKLAAEFFLFTHAPRNTPTDQPELPPSCPHDLSVLVERWADQVNTRILNLVGKPATFEEVADACYALAVPLVALNMCLFLAEDLGWTNVKLPSAVDIDVWLDRCAIVRSAIWGSLACKQSFEVRQSMHAVLAGILAVIVSHRKRTHSCDVRRARMHVLKTFWKWEATAKTSDEPEPAIVEPGFYQLASDGRGACQDVFVAGLFAKCKSGATMGERVDGATMGVDGAMAGVNGAVTGEGVSEVFQSADGPVPGWVTLWRLHRSASTPKHALTYLHRLSDLFEGDSPDSKWLGNHPHPTAIDDSFVGSVVGVFHELSSRTIVQLSGQKAPGKKQTPVVVKMGKCKPGSAMARCRSVFNAMLRLVGSLSYVRRFHAPLIRAISFQDIFLRLQDTSNTNILTNACLVLNLIITHVFESCGEEGQAIDVMRVTPTSHPGVFVLVKRAQETQMLERLLQHTFLQRTGIVVGQALQYSLESARVLVSMLALFVAVRARKDPELQRLGKVIVQSLRVTMDAVGGTFGEDEKQQVVLGMYGLVSGFVNLVAHNQVLRQFFRDSLLRCNGGLTWPVFLSLLGREEQGALEGVFGVADERME